MGFSLEKPGAGQFQRLIDRIFDILPIPPENRTVQVEGHFHGLLLQQKTGAILQKLSLRKGQGTPLGRRAGKVNGHMVLSENTIGSI